MAPGATIVGCCLALGLGTGAAAQSTQGDAAQLMNAAFAPGRTDRAFSSIDHILDSATRAGPGRAYGWTTGQVQLAGGIPNNAVRVSVGGTVAPLNGLISGPQQTRFDPKAYEIAVTRDWPDAVSFSTDRYDVKLTPHAGVGFTNQGGQAEAGAVLTMGHKSTLNSRLKSLGVQDGAAFGNEGRWYLFAAASGRAVGLNMTRSGGEDWSRSWSTDASSTLIGNAQLGIGWRKGPVQTSLGLIHREVKGDYMVWGQGTKDDSMVAFSMAVRPGK